MLILEIALGVTLGGIALFLLAAFITYQSGL